MDIIVDGYNLIGSDQGLTGALDHKRARLVQQLGSYQRLKGFNVFVVFDGWRSGAVNEVAQTIGGIRVIYSRLGEKADSVVIRMARATGSGCVVVSSDREIRNAVEKFGAVAVSAGEFGDILRRAEQPHSHEEYPDPEPRAGQKGNPKRPGKMEKKRGETLRKLRP
jgi:predicted RNA-binding protein with PIN domain